MDIENLIADALSQPKDAIFHRLSVQLRKAFPDLALLETEDGFFRPDMYAHEGHCSLKEHSLVPNQFEYHRSPEPDHDYREIYNAWFEVEWQSNQMQMVAIGQQEQHCRATRYYLLGPDHLILRRFFRAVCEWNAQVRGEVLVFNGQWRKDKRLFESIQSTVLESLVLEGDLKQQILEDFEGFFAAKETYDRYGVAWKRGALFLGPPGNGKTHAIKGLANRLGKPILYVQSFKHQYQTDHALISQAFTRAREAAPCVFVLEDLDSLLDAGNRSFFLNEMDGFAANSGILTIATTNHPERLDPAILERPSRFDRKYTFNLPNTECRRAYLSICNDRLEKDLQLDARGLDRIAALTEEFSYAYLKELVLGAMMSWIAKPGGQRMVELMAAQVDNLREQMRTAPPVPLETDDEGFAVPPGMAKYMARWTRR